MAARKKPHSKAATPKKLSPEFMNKLKQLVRTQGADLLRDPNVSSVGIGYKVRDGKTTKELAIQFTVERKAAPEMLESLGTSELPKSFLVDGVEVPTDVLQRSYQPAFKVIAEASGSVNRKTRLNPIVPGVSVANKRATAGTLGCLVFDRQSGAPLVLSNWHVLHTPQGAIGDDIVQPGPHDDNRVSLNRLGKLVRSHLGVAGDCAVASIEDRSFDAKILDLGLQVEQLGEPELGDKVIKSGRTTAVTHGLVTRIHTLTKVDYGAPIGEKPIGGFEIGPDPAHPPANGEISMGGDSGSVWMFKTSAGKTTPIMAGLHFAGEGPADPNEHAVACYAKSVFEKLEITLTPAAAEAGAVAATGYAADFLGRQIAVPKLSAANRADAVKLNGSEIIPYTHFSLAQSKSRRFCFWVAWNIDGARIRRLSRTGIPFILDPRLPETAQVGDELYAGNRLDRGHVARRADLIWGSDAEAQRANVDSFFFTNITPQMDNFNQGNRGGIWGQLEDAIFEDVDVENLRVSVFGGPVFRRDDRVFRGVKIPREFFKVLAFVEAGRLKARAFLLAQNLNQLELLDLNEFRVFQVTLAELERRCGLAFPGSLRTADGFAERLRTQTEALADRQPLRSLADILW